MWELVEDPAVGANFVVLLIARLGSGGELKASATAYLPNRRKMVAALETEKQERPKEADS